MVINPPLHLPNRRQGESLSEGRFHQETLQYSNILSLADSKKKKITRYTNMQENVNDNEDINRN